MRLTIKKIVPTYKHSSAYRLRKKLFGPETEMFLYLNGFRNKFSTQCVGGMAFEEATIAAGFKDANDAGKLMGLSSYAYAEDKYPLLYKSRNSKRSTRENIPRYL